MYLAMSALASSFVCIILALFLIFMPVKHALANRFFALFLLLTAIDLAGWMITDSGFLNGWLNAFRIILSSLQMPFFIGFITASCFRNFSLKRGDLVHLVPFVLMAMLTLPNEAGIFVTLDEMKILSFALHVQFYLYIALAFMVLKRFKQQFKNEHADNRISLSKWLTQLLWISLLAHSVVAVKSIVAFSDLTEIFYVVQIISAQLVMLILGWLTLVSLLNPSLFRGITVHTEPDVRSGESQMRQINEANAQLLERVLAAERAYLEPTISLRSLAVRLNIPARELSEIINTKYGCHFFDFVNKLRIEEAKNLLQDQPAATITTIMYEVGFNTKSSFNSAFKKHTGLTPSKYRQQLTGLQFLKS